MGQGSTAYASYVRIHEEMGCPSLSDWRALSHVDRMAWEAAAQAVARSLLPSAFGPDGPNGEPFDDEELDDEDLDIDGDGVNVLDVV